MFWPKNKRRYYRAVPENGHPIRLEINGENFIETLSAVSISQKGIGIKVLHEFKGCKINRDVELVITLPYPVNQSILIFGKIRYKTKQIFGVVFTILSREDEKKIRKYISHRIKHEPLHIRFLHLLGII